MRYPGRTLAFVAAAFVSAVLLAPMPSFDKPLSTVVEAADGTLLGARVAADGQWRFPPPDSVPYKYVTALINYEDRWFRWHPGVNPAAVVKALAANIRAGEIVSGGSTITMQVARMARGNPVRSYPEKLLETLSALKLEIFCSKDEILKLYAANAPYGGNSVGLEAAAWRYTGRGIYDLTWAEAATLAVLPNAPSAIYPGKRNKELKTKRDKLLEKLCEREIIDSLSLLLAINEPLPGTPASMPSLAPHLTSRLWLQAEGKRIRTTIDPHLQSEVARLTDRHQAMAETNLIYNAAALVVEVATGNVAAYAGNSTLPDTTGDHGRDVDMITARRSTGSILKPFLYAGLLTDGLLLPSALVPDIPTRFQGFRPENSDFSYSGAIPAGDALARSLNIPAVKMLQMMNEKRFLDLLHRIGFTTFDRPASDYGLSLILGGGEVSLWELAGTYSSMARVLNQNNRAGGYYTGEWHMPSLTAMADQVPVSTDDPPLSAPAIWLTYQALLRVNRPETETGWQYFSNVTDVAWKTGTSYGFRDAWAVGTTPSYVVAVWVGNADGEGRPGLMGISYAAPLLFDIIRLLPPSHEGWFRRPEEGMTLTEVCSQSGYRAGPWCDEKKMEWVPEKGLRSEVCPYHHPVTLDSTGRERVNLTCADPGTVITRSWFILPPAMEYYYRMHNASYRPLPPMRRGCADDRQVPSMEFLYPPPDTKIFIPRNIQGKLMAMLPEIAHRRRDAVIYWHLDNKYIGMTKYIHQTEIQVGEGEHLLTATDDRGETIMRRFTCMTAM